ncbi:MAG: hypothetical protein Q9171_005414 [Xanthocarpia ochracea]
MLPATTKQWTLEGNHGSDSLQFDPSAAIPQLGEREVLVRFHFASLNYRDLIISKGAWALPTLNHIVPVSDGAGTIEAIGPGVHRFQPGDRVLTLFKQGRIAGSPANKTETKSGGGTTNGASRQYAWNALYGLAGNTVKAGDTVLTQGTGGVGMFALQFAKAAGARVIATMGSESKAEIIRSLGADHIINYKAESARGTVAARLSPDSLGVNHIVEVVGPQSMAQSFKAIRVNGCSSIIGFLGGPSTEQQPTFLECLSHECVVRGVYVGSRMLFEDMNRAIDANGIEAVVDGRVFTLEEAKEAYQYMVRQDRAPIVPVLVTGWTRKLSPISMNMCCDLCIFVGMAIPTDAMAVQYQESRTLAGTDKRRKPS